MENIVAAISLFQQFSFELLNKWKQLQIYQNTAKQFYICYILARRIWENFESSRS